MATRLTVRLACLAVLIVAAPSLIADEITNFNDVVPLDSAAYRLLDAAYLDAGLALPSQSRPYSRHEFFRALERLDEARARGRRLSPGGRLAYEEVLRLLERTAAYSEVPEGADDGDGLHFAFTPEVNLEVGGHANLSATPAVGTSGPGYLREHGYEERLPMALLPLEAWLLGPLYGALEFDLKQEYRTVDGRFGPYAPSARGANPTNILVDPLELDFRFPLRAFLAAGGPRWMVQFGREQLSWGPGRSGNFMISDHNDYMEALQFRTWWNAFKFSSMYAVSDSRENGAAVTETDRYLAVAAHRLEFRIGDRVQIGLNEAMTFGQTYPELIRELNPIMIFHNWHLTTSRVSSMLSAEIDVTPLPGLNVWGQYGQNEFETAAEVAAADGGVSNGVTAIAFMAGAEYQRGVGPGLARGGYEWALTYPWFTNHPAAPFLYQSVYWSFLEPALFARIQKPMGYFAGSDAIVHTGWIGYEVPGLFRAEARVQHRVKGEIDLTTPYPFPPTVAMRNDVTPTGTPEYRTVVELGGEYLGFGPWRLGSSLYLVDTRNEHHIAGADRVDVEWSVAVGYQW